LLSKLEEGVHPRQILWYWSTVGNIGKSGMGLWLTGMKNACLLEPSKKADMAHVYQANLSQYVVFDCTRKTEAGAVATAMALAEKIKDGSMFSGKYNSRTVIFKKPHVIFFTNFEPDRTIWSEDRYNVTELDQTSL
jgi:hypothetical protein